MKKLKLSQSEIVKSKRSPKSKKTKMSNPETNNNQKKVKAAPSDNYTEEILRKRFNSYKTSSIELQAINKDTGLNIRNANPPEDITENMVKFIIRNKKGDKSCMWAKCFNKNGDLYSDVEKIQEVKALTSDGPCSFGPTKKFDVIYFLDMREWLSDKIILWCINLTNESKEWKGLKMNATQTHEDQSNQGRRPHIGFDKLYEQLKDYSTKVYEGTFENIFKTEE
jgi:hypothetical protein